MNISKIKNIDYLIIDGTSYLYRAYYAFPELNNYTQPSGAIYGVLNMLRSISFKYPSAKIIIVFDSPHITFRKKIFSEYKKNRLKMPLNLKNQIKPLFYIIKNIGFPIISIKHFEADDIIGTLIKKLCTKNDNFILINTNDKDLAQLVTINVNILDGKSKKILDEIDIEKKYGIKPNLIPDLISLMGDSSDNIPGVPQIGKKTALVLLKHFGTLDEIYKNIEMISKNLFRGSQRIELTLKTHKNLAFLSRKLATIHTNVPIKNFSIKKLNTLPLSIYKVKNFFKYYKFNNWLNLLKQGLWLKTNKNLKN